MAADLSHLLNVDEIKHKNEKTVKGIWVKSYDTCMPTILYITAHSRPNGLD